jgi:hypothetical protein
MQYQVLPMVIYSSYIFLSVSTRRGDSCEDMVLDFPNIRKNILHENDDNK